MVLTRKIAVSITQRMTGKSSPRPGWGSNALERTSKQKLPPERASQRRGCLALRASARVTLWNPPTT